MPLISIRSNVRKAILDGASVDIRQPRKTEEPRWEIGRSYLLSHKYQARFVCTEIRSELLHEADDEQARRELFKNRDDLFEFWRATYKTGPLVEVPTWILTVEFDRADRSEFMARDSSHGYTGDHRHALEPDAEVVPAVWRERFAEDGLVFGELRRLKAREELQGLTLEERLHRAQLQAKAKGRDISRHLRVIERRIQAVEEEAA